MDGGCSTGSPVLDTIVDIFGMFTDPVNTIIKMIARAVLAAAMALFGEIMTSVPTIAVGTSRKIDGQVQWLVVYLAVGSLIFAAARMALERTGTPGITALKGMLRMVLVAGVGTAVVGWSATVAEHYTDRLFKKAVFEIIGSTFGCGSDIDDFLMLVLSLLLLLAGIIHLVLLHIRLGVMIMLMGTLPLAAAASMTDWGGNWWRKHLGWMVAWLMYKPAAGLIIYSGSAMVYDGSHPQPGQDPFGGASLRIAGLGVLALSAIALPAMLKLVVPAVAALGGDGVGAGISGMGKMAGGLATGAKNISAGGGGSAGRDGTGSRGPSGSSNSGGAGGSGSTGAPGRSAAGSAGAAGAAGALALAAKTGAQGAKIVTSVARDSVSSADGDAAWK